MLPSIPGWWRPTLRHRKGAGALSALVLLATFGPPGAGSAAAEPAVVNAKVVPPGLSATVAALRARTSVPIVLPAKLDPGTYASFDEASANAYTLYVDLAPDCKGAHACGYYALTAKRATPADGKARALRIPLGRGVDGDLTASEVTAYPTDTTIAFRLGTTAYVLSVNSHGPDPRALARAIVANLRSVPAPSTLARSPGA
jgi:hypothetical protein